MCIRDRPRKEVEELSITRAHSVIRELPFSLDVIGNPDDISGAADQVLSAFLLHMLQQVAEECNFSKRCYILLALEHKAKGDIIGRMLLIA